MINLTQHEASIQQEEAGVDEPLSVNKSIIKELLTFDRIPSQEDIMNRASLLADIAKREGATKAMIGGAPFFMGALEKELMRIGIAPYYAFSTRTSQEMTKDGKITKISVFVHEGFVKGGN